MGECYDYLGPGFFQAFNLFMRSALLVSKMEWSGFRRDAIRSSAKQRKDSCEK
ncbi:MAG: hypothetical protein ACD_39C00459G0001, partial [uncultured bacterium]